jgi:hypothetical protein
MGIKRPYVETAEKVLHCFYRHHDLNSMRIGEKLGLHPAYVRKALARAGLSTTGRPRRKSGPKPKAS